MKRTELFFALGQATTQIEHDESMRKGAELEGNLYRIVRPQFAGAHRLSRMFTVGLNVGERPALKSLG